ncbi:MAG: PleD family two-component system response regulator [Phycisphaeraceae bacterium JB051]
MNDKPLVLIADDDPDMINQIKLVFKPVIDQVQLIIASNGVEAVTLCRSEKPSLLLLDHGMPGIDGFTACQMIRNMNPDHEMDIWFITGLVDEEDMPLAMEVGADCLISKPINIPHLRHMIVTHLGLEIAEDSSSVIDLTDDDEDSASEAA